MLAFLPAPQKVLLTLLLMCISTLFWCFLLFPAGILRWLLPDSIKPLLTSSMSGIASCWIICNNLFLDLFQKLRINLDNPAESSPDKWYLVICNHQTWADILILQRIFLNRLPMLKFFIKQQLLWVPVIGIAWWALDFPFLKRYTRAELEAHPELRGKDLETTRGACEVFKVAPVAVLNFLEGTRFTPAKRETQESPFKHLLKPRSGGAALVLNVMHDQIDTLVDVTIVYRNGAPGFWDFLCGADGDVSVIVSQHQIPGDMVLGSYEQDVDFKLRFQTWINGLWQQKDQLIQDHLKNV